MGDIGGGDVKQRSDAIMKLIIAGGHYYGGVM